jgi:uncharacterized repeat protein (TIGR03803 family)
MEAQAGLAFVFEITPSGNKYTVLHTFCSQTNCTDRANPFDALVQGLDGNFYGTTEYGGTGTGGLRQGVVFKITPAGKLTVLYNFSSLGSCKDGSNPIGGLVQATDGNFYGTTLGAAQKSNCRGRSGTSSQRESHSFQNREVAWITSKEVETGINCKPNNP